MEHLLQVRQRVFTELRGTKIIKALFAGTPDPGAYVRYLLNAYHYAQYSPKVMAIAAARCMDTHPPLATYLLHHAGEEQGHHQWALEDLRDLNVNEEEMRATPPVPSCAAMVGYVHYIAAYANPVGLFGWMYVLEAVGNDLGTLVAQQLRAVLGSSGKGTRFVARHGASDVDHTKDLTLHIREYVRREEDRRAVSHVADVVADLYTRMFREIGKEQQRWG
ncbi:MAG TPA: iron-containing redox enzyme family protein [Candidatus Binatia bacterium]|jgi:pyrroloquinoline quinone (PQQ) biosynthesis protein C|nr:iron-containing redox enzyme family protein [Candidatus Binatia bacterium]